MADIKNEEVIQADNASVEANLKGASEHHLAPGTEKRIAVEKKLKRKLDARSVIGDAQRDMEAEIQVLSLRSHLHPQLP